MTGGGLMGGLIFSIVILYTFPISDSDPGPNLLKTRSPTRACPVST